MFDWTTITMKKTKKTYSKVLSRGPLTDWCDETRDYQFKTNLVTFSNKKYLYRKGVDEIGFISIHKNDFTIVHIYRKKDGKKIYLSTKRFSGKLSWKLVRDVLFKNSDSLASVSKRTSRPFKMIHKHVILSMEEFKEVFKPNQQMKKSYSSTAKDTALTSLSRMLEDSIRNFSMAGTYSAAFNNITRAINFRCNSYTEDFPAVSIHAIWSNYDPESRLINTGKFDIGEPVMYEYKVIRK